MNEGNEGNLIFPMSILINIKSHRLISINNLPQTQQKIIGVVI